MIQKLLNQINNMLNTMTPFQRKVAKKILKKMKRNTQTRSFQIYEKMPLEKNLSDYMMITKRRSKMQSALN